MGVLPQTVTGAHIRTDTCRRTPPALHMHRQTQHTHGKEGGAGWKSQLPPALLTSTFHQPHEAAAAAQVTPSPVGTEIRRLGRGLTYTVI